MEVTALKESPRSTDVMGLNAREIGPQESRNREYRRKRVKHTCMKLFLIVEEREGQLTPAELCAALWPRPLWLTVPNCLGLMPGLWQASFGAFCFPLGV